MHVCPHIMSSACLLQFRNRHAYYIDVIMTTMASQITSLTVVYSTVYWDADKRKHQSSASLAFVWGIHRSRWIPRTKGQLCGKCFHLMTSSWIHRPHSHRASKAKVWGFTYCWLEKLLLNKQSSGRWFEVPVWRHCNVDQETMSCIY